jgi:hypothetical protein
MDLEHLSVALRQRNPWEAIDLGFAMVRQWWRDLYGVWLAVLIPLTVVACLLLPAHWAGVFVWWLKPALDRIVLHVTASAVFGVRPGWRATLRAFPSYARTGLIGSLLWNRFSPHRSFWLPVRQLENARGSSGRARLKQLRRRVGSQASWLTVICMHFEFVAMISLIGLYVLLLPGMDGDLDSSVSWFQHLNDSGQAYIGTALWVASIALIEPLYVAGGFALYLNRRTVLEGWDLEVQLRSIAQQSEARAAAPVSVSVAVPVAGLLFALGLIVTALPGWTGPAHAQAPSKAQEEIKEVLKDPVFGKYERRTRIESLHPAPKQQRAPDLDGFAAFMQTFAQVLRFAVWIALAIALLLVLRWLLSHIKFKGDAQPAPEALPEVLFGLDVRPESLPKDVAAAALALAARGQMVAALSLLYRGALVSLLHRDGIQLATGDTEADCLAKVKPTAQRSTHDYLTRLVASWQAAAYAHRMPERVEVEELATQWRNVFGTAG